MKLHISNAVHYSNLIDVDKKFGVQYRDRELRLALAALRNNRSVVFVGPPGAGKGCMINEVERHFLLKKKFIRMSTSDFEAGTKWSGEFQTKTKKIITDTIKNKNILIFNDLWSIHYAGRNSSSTNNAWDMMSPSLDSGKLQFIATVTPEQYAAVQNLPSFQNCVQRIDVAYLTQEEVINIVNDKIRQSKFVSFSLSGRLIDLVSRFMPGNSRSVSKYMKFLDYLATSHPDALPSQLDEIFCEFTNLNQKIVSEEPLLVPEVQDFFEDRILGQKHAVDAVVNAICGMKLGLSDENKPLASFLFFGPTGVGKTETAKALAEYFFSDSDAMVRLNMSEYTDYHAKQRLIGYPKLSEFARLTDPIKSNPFQVVLLDEIDKCTPEVLDLFLQVLDEANIQPQNSQESVSFKSTIIVMTTNAGADVAMQNRIGFQREDNNVSVNRGTNEVLEHCFRKEFLNRFNHVVYFTLLSSGIMKNLVERELTILKDKLYKKCFIQHVYFDNDCLQAILDKCDSQYGARSVKIAVHEFCVPLIRFVALHMDKTSDCLINVSLGKNGKMHIVPNLLRNEKLYEKKDSVEELVQLLRGYVVKKLMKGDRVKQIVNTLESN